MSESPSPGRPGRVAGLVAAAAARLRDRPRELKAAFRAWRDLVAVGRNLRRHGKDWDELYSMAMLADASSLVDWRFIHFLALRRLHRLRFLDGYGTLGPEEAEALSIATFRAGRIADSLRLAEHAGALNMAGPIADQELDEGMRAAVQGPARFNLHFAGIRRPAAESVLVDLAFGTVRWLRWLPGPVADELFPLPFAMLEGLLEAPGAPAMRGTAPTPYPLVNWWRRRHRPAAEDDGALRLSFRAAHDDIVFRATAGGRSVEGALGAIVPFGPKEQLYSAGHSALSGVLVNFHHDGRTGAAATLELLRYGGLIVDAAIARLALADLPTRLVAETSGVMGSLPWPALRSGDGTYLVERFEIEVDDGLRPAAAESRPPRLTALAGESPAMAREAAWATGIAREAGFPTDLPLPLTRDHLAAALSSSSIVHVATHFRARPFHAGAGELQTADGSWLALDEIGADLHGLELLFLAACETGIALDDVDGSGGSGTDPWRIAGAASVISTLWRVNDEIAPLVAEQFYRRLFEGQSRAMALAGSQRQLLRAGAGSSSRAERFVTLSRAVDSGRPFDPAHPRMWGAFRLTGDGGPVNR